ncbi:cupredoxin domain-containing protein [Janibacter cremeus]|uniref:Plastocyanin n=1 Tax=Janibacter cremeus TaxID=1285192 RepID=A0A852VTB6_9MICO|nr:plastocyanin [Janibacter cremeus]
MAAKTTQADSWRSRLTCPRYNRCDVVRRGSATTTTPGESESNEVTITISDFTYSVPDSVPAGAEITVTNSDEVGHTVTADSGDTFDVAVEPGATVTFTAPESAGEYAFHCIPHPAMTSTLVVE